MSSGFASGFVQELIIGQSQNWRSAQCRSRRVVVLGSVTGSLLNWNFRLLLMVHKFLLPFINTVLLKKLFEICKFYLTLLVDFKLGKYSFLIVCSNHGPGPYKFFTCRLLCPLHHGHTLLTVMSLYYCTGGWCHRQDWYRQHTLSAPTLTERATYTSIVWDPEEC